jgi:DNA-binding transcriptional regulator YhcF (GntR family)
MRRGGLPPQNSKFPRRLFPSSGAYRKPAENFPKFLLPCQDLYDNHVTLSTAHMSRFRSSFSKLPAAHSLSDQVVQALVARIESGQFSPGQRIPAEAVLASELDFSRTVSREAISRLKREGLLGSRQGSGVFVTARPLIEVAKKSTFRRPLTCSIQPEV